MQHEFYTRDWDGTYLDVNGQPIESVIVPVAQGIREYPVWAREINGFAGLQVRASGHQKILSFLDGRQPGGYATLERQAYLRRVAYRLHRKFMQLGKAYNKARYPERPFPVPQIDIRGLYPVNNNPHGKGKPAWRVHIRSFPKRTFGITEAGDHAAFCAAVEYLGELLGQDDKWIADHKRLWQPHPVTRFRKQSRRQIP